MVSKPAAGLTSVVPSGTEARGTSPQARLVVARVGKYLRIPLSRLLLRVS
jgi:hypothetical protein